MFKLLKEYRFYVTIAMLVLLPILAMNISPKEKDELGTIDRTILMVTSPVQEVINWTVDHTATLFQNYIFLVNLNKNYNELVEENRKLNNVIHNFSEMEQENKRLRSLLDFQKKIEEKTVTAQVIAKDVSLEFKSIRLNKGSKAGIEKGMPVVTHEGVVGKVLRTTTEYSDVITALDDLSAIDSIVQRSRSHGVFEGAGDLNGILKYVLRTDDIEVGDTVITSGLDQIFPKGMLVGTVTKVVKKSYGISQEVQVKPSVDFTKLEEVFVLIKPDKQLMM